MTEISRKESYTIFLEDKEHETMIYNKIMNASKEELVKYLISSCEVERWTAQNRMKDLQKNSEENLVSST